VTVAERDGFSRHARARARRTAVQALYQWDLTNQPVDSIIKEFESERAELRKADKDYFRRIVSGVVEHRDVIARGLNGLLDRSLMELDPVERAILLLGTYELMFQLELPWRVVVNESVDLAKMFGAEQSYKYINGVLDAAARQLRAEEAGTGS
jgi:N utilization substance protein B